LCVFSSKVRCLFIGIKEALEALGISKNLEVSFLVQVGD